MTPRQIARKMLAERLNVMVPNDSEMDVIESGLTENKRDHVRAYFINLTIKLKDKLRD